MSNTNNMNLNIISQSDTIRDFMEKCNDNFSKLSTLSGPAGIQGEQGEQGVPTKPKVPIHAWTKGVEYINDDNYTISVNGNELTDSKYQEGHLIILENAHVYVLEIENNSLTPRFKIALQSYEQGSVIDGKNAYVHFAYADDVNGANMIIPNQNYQAVNAGEESISTFSLTRAVSNNNSNISEKPYMGMYCSRSSEPSTNPDIYTWVRIRGRDGDVGPTGPQGSIGPQGPQGPEGSPFNGQNYTIDLQGDMTMVSLNIDRTIQNGSSSCKCTIYAYYGDENVNLNKNNVSFIVDKDGYVDKNLKYKIVNDENNKLILWEATNGKLGEFTISQKNKDVDIEFIPESTFIFPETTLIFPIQINSTIEDEDGKIYNFTRKTIWSIKGIVSNFSLEIVPQYRTIKLSDGTYTPNILKVDVFKLEDGKRTLFILNENPNYELLYKNYSSNTWNKYKDVNSGNGVSTNGVSCLEFKLVKNYQSTDPNNIEEIWDYEDVWVVADGRGTHYYYADLGNTESMMVLTTGEKINIGTDEEPKYCADIRNKDGYSITFNPKFYDGTEEYNSSNGYTISINLGEDIDTHNGTFVYNLSNNTFTVTSVPYGVDMIPITFNVKATNEVETYTYSDSIPFNIYISTITNIYTLVPSVSAFNTSAGIDGDVISCAVYKNNEEIETTELSNYGLYLAYTIYNSDGSKYTKEYTDSIKYGKGEGNTGDFTASNVGIEFILYYSNEPVVRSTVPLIKDGIDGEDGNNWQYIFCRLNEYPYPYQSDKGLNQNPSTWYENTDDNKPHTDPNEEYIHEDFDDIWSDDHQGVDKDHKYEYQSYRKWNKEGKYWGEYTSPTLYSNYSEDGKDGRSGSGYSVLLSNPVAVIPVGDDWTADKEDSTIVYLYDNVSEIKDFDIEVDIDIDSEDSDPIVLNSEHFEIDGHKIIFTPTIGEGSELHTFDFDSNTPFKLPIKITYVGNSEDEDFTTTINWTLMPIKGLDDVEVFVDKRVVNISEETSHSITVGYYLISSNDDRKFVGNHDKRGKYDIMITNDISNLTEDKIVSKWSDYQLNFSSTTKYFVVLVEKDENNTYNLIDSIDITPISDGKDGSSAIHLELTNDYIPVPCNNAGELHEQFTESISSQMILYDGDALITSNDIEYKLTINDVEYYESENTSGVNIKNDGTFSIDNSFIYENITGDTHITCTAIYNNVPYHKTLFIDFELNPYELELNKQVLVRDVNNGNKITDTLAVRVKYWDSNTAGWVYIKREDDNNNRVNFVKLNGENNFTYVHQEDANDWYWKLDFSDLTDTNSTEFKISYYKNESELSHEYIGVVDSGKNGVDGAPGEDGTTPTNTSVTVLGYSIKNKETCEGAINIIESEIKADNSVWRPSISDWGSEVKPGQTIYILNKHTWVDENGSPLPSTRSISTTMAGTQGVDGKSRVLFYLGSFEKDKATLPDDSIMGHLTPERCDYYIDYNGQAWMRIGQEDKDNGGLGVMGDKGSKDANNNSVNNNSNSDNWQKSEIVGFLQTGAIHANMINVDSLSANTAFVEAIQTMTVYADEITGKTIKSGNINPNITDDNYPNGIPTWQISNIGEGWLASKNIHWDEKGNITINGNIKGNINQGDNVNVLGNLVIKPNRSLSKAAIIYGKHEYIDPQNTEETKNRNIVFSSGLYEELYEWELESHWIYEDNFQKQYLNIYSRSDFNLNKIRDFTSDSYKTTINHNPNVDNLIYYKVTDTNGNVYFHPLKSLGDFSIDTYDIHCGFSNITGNKWANIYFNTYQTSDSDDNNSITIQYSYKNKITISNYDNINIQGETANTIIFSDGEIKTNSLFATSGLYYGDIYSSGEFKGTLINAGGSINEGNIKNSSVQHSNIEIYNENTISAYTNVKSESETKIKNIFYLNPNLTISNSSSVIHFNNISWSKKDKEVKNRYTSIHNVVIGKLWVPASSSTNSPSATIDVINVSASAYQPRVDEGKLTVPGIQIYWRYVGYENVSDGNTGRDSDQNLHTLHYFLTNFNPTTKPGDLKLNSQSNNGRTCKWNGQIENIPIYAPTSGEIEILACFTATITPKQLLDYPYVYFSVDGFKITTTSAYTPENNSVTICNNGVIIKSGDGSQLITSPESINDSGTIRLMSSDNNYGIKVDDTGIYFKNGNNWSKVEVHTVNNLNYLVLTDI